MDKEKIRAYHKQYYEINKIRINAQSKAYERAHKEQRNATQKRYDESHREERKEYHTRYVRAIKQTVLDHYGNRCACCNETLYEFLTIDHINGGGCEHRKKIHSNIYKWLIDNNYPEGFQVLCMNCNFSRGKYGYCPHKRTNYP